MVTNIEAAQLASDALATCPRLTGKQRRHFQQVREGGTANTRSAQPLESYWDRKIRGLNIFQLRNLARRIPKRSRRAARLLSKLHKASRFAAPLRHEAWANNLKMSIVTDEAIRRNAFVA